MTTTSRAGATSATAAATTAIAPTTATPAASDAPHDARTIAPFAIRVSLVAVPRHRGDLVSALPTFSSAERPR